MKTATTDDICSASSLVTSLAISPVLKLRGLVEDLRCMVPNDLTVINHYLRQTNIYHPPAFKFQNEN